MAEFEVYLYVAGKTPRSQMARRNLQVVLNDLVDGKVSVVVIDVVDEPAIAESERILATPVAVRVVPQPARRVVGDFSDADALVSGLDLPRRPSEKPNPRR